MVWYFCFFLKWPTNQIVLLMDKTISLIFDSGNKALLMCPHMVVVVLSCHLFVSPQLCPSLSFLLPVHSLLHSLLLVHSLLSIRRLGPVNLLLASYNSLRILTWMKQRLVYLKEPRAQTNWTLALLEQLLPSKYCKYYKFSLEVRSHLPKIQLLVVVYNNGLTI